MKNYKYMKHEIQVIEVKTEGMLAVSSDFLDVNPNGSGTPATNRFGDWDDEKWLNGE